MQSGGMTATADRAITADDPGQGLVHHEQVESEEDNGDKRNDSSFLDLFSARPGHTLEFTADITKKLTETPHRSNSRRVKSALAAGPLALNSFAKARRPRRWQRSFRILSLVHGAIDLLRQSNYSFSQKLCWQGYQD